MKKISDLSLETITTIQLSIATVISLLFQFVFPLSWQPLDAYKYGDIKHGDPRANLVIFTITQWWFSLSIAWFFYRDNRYLNNFLIGATLPLGMILFYEFIFIGLYYDYIHLLPVIVGIWIIKEKRDTLERSYIPYSIIIVLLWGYTVFFLQLAYHQATLLEFTINLSIQIVCTTVFVLIVSKGNKSSPLID